VNLEQLDVQPEGRLDGLRSGTWLDHQEFPPLAYAIPGIVPEGVSVLVGAPKIGKSWMVLGWALAAASGGTALSAISVDPRPVLYLALEDGDRRMQSRCRTLLCGAAIPELFFYMTRIGAHDVAGTIGEWLARHPGKAPFVIVDTLAKVMPLTFSGETTYQRDYRIMGDLKQTADQFTGCAILINHHDRKATADDFVDAVSGTHGIAGGADTVIVVRRRRTEPEGVIAVTGRDVAEDEYAVRFDGADWMLEGHDLAAAAAAMATREAMAGLGDRSADIIRYLTAQGSGRAGDVEAALHLDHGQGKVYLQRLEKAGRITKQGRGLYAPSSNPVTSVTSVTFPEPSQLSDTEGKGHKVTAGVTFAHSPDQGKPAEGNTGNGSNGVPPEEKCSLCGTTPKLTRRGRFNQHGPYPGCLGSGRTPAEVNG
jgi:hypothetical protein